MEILTTFNNYMVSPDLVPRILGNEVLCTTTRGEGSKHVCSSLVHQNKQYQPMRCCKCPSLWMLLERGFYGYIILPSII